MVPVADPHAKRGVALGRAKACEEAIPMTLRPAHFPSRSATLALPPPERRVDLDLDNDRQPLTGFGENFSRRSVSPSSVSTSSQAPMNSAIAMPDSFFTSAARKAAEPSKAIRNMRSMSRSGLHVCGPSLPPSDCAHECTARRLEPPAAKFDQEQ